MILVKWLRVVLGYVVITVSGKYPERFLNLCAKHGIRVWNSRRYGNRVELCAFARDYKRMRRFRRDCAVTLAVRRKCGLPFWCFRYRKRAGLAVGAVLCCAVLAVLPNFVWSIDIHAEGDVDTDEVRDALDALGLHIGTPLACVDAGDLRHQLTLRVPSVSWAAINDYGTQIRVEVRAVEAKEDGPDGYANVVAVREGQVCAMTVRVGLACVHVGDAVAPGQMLVSGTEPYTDGTTHFRYADAEIIAETTRTVSASVARRQTVLADDGNATVRRVVSVFGLRLPLYVGEVTGRVRREVERRDLVIDGVTLPAWIATARFTPVKEKTVTLTASVARERAEAELRKKLETELRNAEILSTNMTVSEQKETVTATAVCSCRENIARIEPFTVEETK